MGDKDEETEPVEELLQVGTITITVYLGEEADEDFVLDTEIEGLGTHQVVGILEHVKFEQLFWPTVDAEDE